MKSQLILFNWLFSSDTFIFRIQLNVFLNSSGERIASNLLLTFFSRTSFCFIILSLNFCLLIFFSEFNSFLIFCWLLVSYFVFSNSTLHTFFCWLDINLNRCVNFLVFTAANSSAELLWCTNRTSFFILITYIFFQSLQHHSFY